MIKKIYTFWGHKHKFGARSHYIYSQISQGEIHIYV